MQNFKQYLTEAKANFAPWQNPNETIESADDYIFYIEGSIKQNKNGTFTSRSKNLWVTPKKLDDGRVVIPIKFSRVDSIGFREYGIQLTTLEGCPDIVKDSFTLHSEKLKSLEDLSYNLRFIKIDCKKLNSFGTANIHCNQVWFDNIGSVSIREIQKHFTIDYNFSVSPDSVYKKPILSLLKVKGNWQKVYVSGNQLEDKPKEVRQELKQVFTIINESNKDIIVCQEALIDAGLKDYAEF